ncbi:MAG: hypothetical protein GY755_07225 [Chloroflexi bacterium]|nr:hypothetical protein [Chloroflexota bacterium]
MMKIRSLRGFLLVSGDIISRPFEKKTTTCHSSYHYTIKILVPSIRKKGDLAHLYCEIIFQVLFMGWQEMIDWRAKKTKQSREKQR